MLLQLNIQNYAIVRSLDIDWQQGMTTITGETGAGKSIAIDALGLCLGERATGNVVRPNCKKTELAATFEIESNTTVQKWLLNHDLALDIDNSYECILRRVISTEGRSKAYINGSQVPLIQLKEIGQLLVNIHGQNDHQLIVKTNQQGIILDNYADHQHLLDDVKHYYQQWKNLSAELKSLQENKLHQEAKQQLIQYQVNELDEFSLQPKEFETLEADYKRYSNAQDLLDATLKSMNILADDDNFNILDSLRQCSDSLSALASVDSHLKSIANLLSESLIQIDEASTDLRDYYNHLELDPQHYSAIESRYSTVLQLAKKHQIPPEKLADFHQKLKQELTIISHDESRINIVLNEIEQSIQLYTEAADILSISRIKSAQILSKSITISMKELNMPHGQFLIDVSTTKVEQTSNNKNEKKEISLSLKGLDNITFKVSINPGQTLEAMHKVASGGELSRISLAMQVILAEKVITPTLIFDEVDVGISGPTAAMVGKKLQQLAKNTQVICVTHLPQVACKGHQQLFVSKLTDGESTETKITELNSERRVQEIARLLAGDTISEHSLANAQELLAS